MMRDVWGYFNILVIVGETIHVNIEGTTSVKRKSILVIVRIVD